jgi:hypothetical protein
MHSRTKQDHRRAARQRIDVGAVLRGWKPRTEWCHDASVEDQSASGIRIRSALALERNTVVVIHPARDGALPVYARVVWTREDGVIAKGTMRKWGVAHLAGCAIVAAPQPSLAGNLGRLALRRLPGLFAKLILWLALIGATSLVLALLIYGIAAIVAMFVA